MALLRVRNYHGARILVRIEPVPSDNPDEDAAGFSVSVQSTDHTLDWEAFYPTVPESGAPDELWLAARVFSAGRQLLGANLAVDLWGTGRTHPAALTIWADWVQIFFSAHRGRNTLCATFFFQDQDSPLLYRRLFVDATFEEAGAFGSDLETEIILANPGWARSIRASGQQTDEPDNA